MEPPQLAGLAVLILTAAGLFILASYEATFSILSRSSLEKMAESRVSRAALMLRIYEPRHRLHLMARLGQGLGAILAALSLLLILLPLVSSTLQAAPVAAALAACVFFLSSLAQRVRFDDDDEETHIPVFTLAYLPMHAILGPVTNLLERIAAGDYSDEDFKAEKEEELRSLVESERESGVLEEGERDMIEGVFGFHDRVVREVMVPRVDVAAVEQTASLLDLLASIRETGHSRVPVYEESLDHIRGVVYAKDLLRLLDQQKGVELSTTLVDVLAADGDRRALVREPYYVPETKKIDELLRDLRSARTRLAVVVDEYGGTAGLVTTEDLIEEIVGEIQDEYDEEEELYRWEREAEVLVVNPRINIEELNDVLDADLPSEGFDTLGGFIYDHLGHVPDAGQSFAVPGLQVAVLKVEGQRISQVRITLVPGAESDQNNGGNESDS